jgi:hypothetical protein
MSSITNDRSQERLRQMQGDGERNYSPAGIGSGGAAASGQQERPPQDPVAVSLKMEALAQNVVDSNHKVSSAISFLNMQGEILGRFSSGFHRIAEIHSHDGDSIDSGQAPRDAFRNIVSGLPDTKDLFFNGDQLFNSTPLRISFYRSDPEPAADAIDLERPDIEKFTRVPREVGVPMPLVNVSLEEIPEEWIRQSLRDLSGLLSLNVEEANRLTEIRNSLNVAPDESGRELDALDAVGMTGEAGTLLLSSLDTGNAYHVQAHLTAGAVGRLLRS